MRWTPGGRSADLEDERGSSGRGGGGFGLPHLGIGGFIVLLILSFVFKRNLFTLLGAGGGPGGPAPVAGPPPPTSPEEEKLIQFVSFVLDDVQNTWSREFARRNRTYEKAKLVLFTDAVQSGCGFAESAMGPFYCPENRKVYIDLGFYRELRDRFGAPGDFAQAYVLAHEIGHHVQNLLGIEQKVRRARGADPSRANDLSVRTELQADCLAGVWGHSTEQRNLLEQGDIEEGLNAAAAVGDDRIQRETTGRVSPETWTHGSSKERARWFRTGLETGDIDSCDTFSAR
jgi:uncharacterized protein